MTSRRHLIYYNFKGKTKGYVTNVIPIGVDIEATSIKDTFISSCKLLRPVSIAKAHVNCQLFHDIIFFMKALALHPIWVKKLFTYGTLIANPHKLPQTKWTIHVSARNHNNVITMESPQTKPTTLDNQKGGAIKIDMGIEMDYGFWSKKNSIHFFHAFKLPLNCFFFIF